MLGRFSWKIDTDVSKGGSAFVIRAGQSNIGLCDPEKDAVSFSKRQ
jgi:hypothetical protein